MAEKKNGKGFADVRGEDASAESDEAHFEDASSGLQDDPAGVGRNPIPPIPSTPTTDEAAPLAAPLAALLDRHWLRPSRPTRPRIAATTIVRHANMNRLRPLPPRQDSRMLPRARAIVSP